MPLLDSVNLDKFVMDLFLPIIKLDGVFGLIKELFLLLYSELLVKDFLSAWKLNTSVGCCLVNEVEDFRVVLCLAENMLQPPCLRLII